MPFIMSELAFEDDESARQFACEYGGESLLSLKTLPTPAVWLATGKAGPLFENARAAAFRKVDIKGQI